MKELTGDLFGNVPAPVDDWPDDFDIQFWDAWPRHPRKHSQKQVADKLARIRKAGGIVVRGKLVPVTWAQIWGGLTAYVASNPEHKFIPAPLVWVNQARWTANHDAVEPAKPSFGDIMRGGVARHG